MFAFVNRKEHHWAYAWLEQRRASKLYFEHLERILMENYLFDKPASIF